MTKCAKAIVWVGGQADQPVDPADRGLAYGDGLFETMRFERGRLPLLDLHLQRLRAGCKALSIIGLEELLPGILERIYAEMRGVSEPERDLPHTVKLIVTRGLGGHGYTPPHSSTIPTVIVRIAPLQVEQTKSRDGVYLHLCRWRLALIPLLAGIKHLNRLEYVLAAQELVEQQDAAQGLLLDANGRVVESLHHNVFIVKRAELITPRIAMCGVKGVMRKLIIEQIAPEVGLPVREQDLSIDDLIGAEELFLCNSVHGIWPVNEFRSSSWRPGPVTQQLQAAITEYWQRDNAY